MLKNLVIYIFIISECHMICLLKTNSLSGVPPAYHKSKYSLACCRKQKNVIWLNLGIQDISKLLPQWIGASLNLKEHLFHQTWFKGWVNWLLLHIQTALDVIFSAGLISLHSAERPENVSCLKSTAVCRWRTVQQIWPELKSNARSEAGWLTWTKSGWCVFMFIPSGNPCRQICEHWWTVRFAQACWSPSQKSR